MGAGASANVRPTFDEDWASDSTRGLDSLGGGLRPPVKRGLSTKFRLEWLKDALTEQGDKLEEALAKDPLAGRHEILRQEAIKMVKDNPASIHSFSVKEWMTRKHSDMRAQHARDELERRMRERMGLPPAEPPPPVASEKERRSEDKQTSDDGGEPAKPVRPEVPLAEWRHRVARAKRKAMLIISVHLADQLPRFVDEQGSYRAGKASVANLQALAEELWREQNYGAAEAAALEAGEEAGVALSLGEIGGVGPSPLNSSDLGGAGTGAVTTAGGRGTQPWSPGTASTAGTGAGSGGGGFEPPQVYEAAKFASVMGAAQSAAFKSEVAAALRAGRMAVQVLAGDDNVILASGTTQALWNADPWDLIATAFPAKAGTPDRIRADQRADVIADLRFRKFCGLRPDNLFLLVQTRRCGYAWDEAAQRFARQYGSQPASAGSGYAIMQLVWPQEALQLAAEDPLQMSVLDALAARGVQWLLTRRLRDINLYHPERTLDGEVLAYGLFLHDSMGANMSVQVEYVDGVQATPRVTALLNEARLRGKGRLVVSTRRYMWKIDVLKALVQRPSVFRPSLEVAADLAYLTFDMADLTAAAQYGARCVALASRHPARSLISAADLEELMGDASGNFRRLAGNTTRIVVLVADNDSTGLAVKLLMAMVKPGRDVVILVHVVSSILQEGSGRALLRKYELLLGQTMVEVVSELLTKDPSTPLLEQLETYCENVDAQLVVMGSQLLNSQRGDKLYLGRGGAKDPSAQDNVTSRRLLENFSDLAAQHGLAAVKRPLEEGFESGALRLADLEKVHVLAMQAPSGRGLPASIMHVLKAARSAVLVYKSNELF
eukprot:XP_001689725.1 predicted protein [Chlamydomonas reinhardtii]